MSNVQPPTNGDGIQPIKLVVNTPYLEQLIRRIFPSENHAVKPFVRGEGSYDWPLPDGCTSFHVPSQLYPCLATVIVNDGTTRVSLHPYSQEVYTELSRRIKSLSNLER